MAIGIGITSKAGFRVGKRSTSYAYPTTVALAAAAEQKITAYDLLPFTSEGVTPEHQFIPTETLGGVAGATALTETGRMGGGRLVIDGHYLGLDQLIACALGFEKFGDSTSTVDKSPSFTESKTGDTTDSTHDSTPCTTTRIYALTPDFFTADSIGEWIRVRTPSTWNDYEVRRITAINVSPNYATITPALNNAPGLSVPIYQARAFTHTFECAVNQHEESFTMGAGTYNRVRHGTLVFDKNVGLWAWHAVMVESMTIRLTPERVTFEFELVPFDLDLASAVNTSSAAWDYSASAVILQERMRFADANFWMDIYSGSAYLEDADKLGISQFELTIKNNLSVGDRDTKSGLYRVEPARSGFRQVTGSFTVPRYTANTRLTNLIAGTIMMAQLRIQGSLITGVGVTRNQLDLYLRSFKITGIDTVIQGAGIIAENVKFTCLQPAATPAGMPASSTGSDNSEVIMTIQNGNPYNAFMEQDAETS